MSVVRFVTGLLLFYGNNGIVKIRNSNEFTR